LVRAIRLASFKLTDIEGFDPQKEIIIIIITIIKIYYVFRLSSTVGITLHGIKLLVESR